MRLLIAVLCLAIAVIFIFTQVLFIREHLGILKPAFPSSAFVKRTVKISEVASRDSVTKNYVPPYSSNIKPTVGDWHNVTGTKEKFYVYSAFLERRKGQMLVRIIGVTKRENPEKVWCRFRYEPIEGDPTNGASKTTAAEVKVIREHHGLYYSACFILCRLQKDQLVPTMVSVVADLFKPPTNLLIVNDNYNVAIPTNKFGVCVKPLLNNYNEDLRILEFIELNRILGVTHFTLYNHTIGPKVNCLLKDYFSRGIVTVHPWQFEITSLKKIRLYGMFAAFNDCLYRSMYRFSHILVIDLDEYIIPRRNYSLPQLIHTLKFREKPNKKISAGSYSFQNGFFYLGWDDDKWVYTTNDTIAANLLTLKKTRRRVHLNPHSIRSKYICKPERVVEVGNHFVWEFIPGYQTYNVPPDVAILHHYRSDCESENAKNCLKLESRIDPTLCRYRDSLVSAVKEILPYAKDKCGLEDLQLPTRLKSRVVER